MPFLLKHVIELGFHQLLERFPATAGRFERQRQAAKIANERAALDIACAHRFPRLRHKRALAAAHQHKPLVAQQRIGFVHRMQVDTQVAS